MADKCFSQYVHSFGGGQIFGSADKRQHFCQQKERPYLRSDREAVEILTIDQLGLRADFDVYSTAQSAMPRLNITPSVCWITHLVTTKR
jgi:hypothetical protein